MTTNQTPPLRNPATLYYPQVIAHLGRPLSPDERDWVKTWTGNTPPATLRPSRNPNIRFEELDKAVTEAMIDLTLDEWAMANGFRHDSQTAYEYKQAFPTDVIAQSASMSVLLDRRLLQATGKLPDDDEAKPKPKDHRDGLSVLSWFIEKPKVSAMLVGLAMMSGAASGAITTLVLRGW